MINGTIENMRNSAFVRTPPTVTKKILNLLSFAAKGVTNVLDPASGEGDLLQPITDISGISYRLYGIEISEERLAVARRNVPGVTWVRSPFEATRIPERSMSLVITNPPYAVQDGERLEYRFIRDSGKTLIPGGVMVAIIPARSAWNGTLVRHMMTWYDRIQVYRFPGTYPCDEAGVRAELEAKPDGSFGLPEDAFARFTQIVVIGTRRVEERKLLDEDEKKRLVGFRYKEADRKEGEEAAPWQPGHTEPWIGGVAPALLPDERIKTPYGIPASPVVPEIRIVRADDSTLLQKLEENGSHLVESFHRATSYTPETEAERIAMPIRGSAHLGAKVLNQVADGEIIIDPDGTPTVITTFTTQKFVDMEIDEDMRKQHEKSDKITLVGAKQLEDHSVLGRVNLITGEATYYDGDHAFSYIQPRMGALAQIVVDKCRPIYDCNPTDHELDVLARIGLDFPKLPGAEFSGFQDNQIHAVMATWRLLTTYRSAALQAEMGTGKTLMGGGGLAALAADVFHSRYERLNRKQRRATRWLSALLHAWRNNPNTVGDAPRAVPIIIPTPNVLPPVGSGRRFKAFLAAKLW